MKKLAFMGVRNMVSQRQSDTSRPASFGDAAFGAHSSSSAFVAHRPSRLLGLCGIAALTLRPMDVERFGAQRMGTEAAVGQPLVDHEEEETAPSWVDDATKEKMALERAYERSIDELFVAVEEPSASTAMPTTTSAPTTRTLIAEAGLTFTLPREHSAHIGRLPCTRCHQPMSAVLEEVRHVLVCLHCDHLDERLDVSSKPATVILQ